MTYVSGFNRAVGLVVGFLLCIVATVVVTAAPSAAADGSFELEGHGGQCLDVPSQNAVNGQDLWMWPCNQTVAQRWTFDNGRLKVMGKCLDIEGPSRAREAPVQIWDCQDVGQHQWKITGDGQIISLYSGLCLDVAYGATSPGAVLHMWECNGTSAQRWSLRGLDGFAKAQISCEASNLINSIEVSEYQNQPRYLVEPSNRGRALLRNYEGLYRDFANCVAPVGANVTSGLLEQLGCHPASGLARPKSTWNLEASRPSVGASDTLRARCNPT